MKKYRVKYHWPLAFHGGTYLLQRRFLWIFWITIRETYTYHICVRDIDKKDLIEL